MGEIYPNALGHKHLARVPRRNEVSPNTPRLELYEPS